MIETWWARTTVHFPGWLEVAFREEGRIHLRGPEGSVRFRGAGGAEAIWWTESTEHLRVLAQFFIDRARITGPASLYESAPVAEIAGTMGAGSGPGAVFDNPSIAAHLHLRQDMFLGGSRAASLATRTTLLDIQDRSHARQRREFLVSEPMRFPPIYILLDGTRDVGIHLELTLELVRDGDGGYSFTPLEDEERFWLRIPQWWLRDSREITLM